jgi:hypothetical protein
MYTWLPLCHLPKTEEGDPGFSSLNDNYGNF